MRRAARVDENQSDIVFGLRKIGAFVQPLHQVGQGCPDILVGWRQKWFLFEIKRDSKSKLTEDEKRWFEDSQGKAPVFIVTSAIEAINFMQQVKP